MAKSTSEAARAQAVGLAKSMMAGLGGGAAGPASGDAPNYGDDNGKDPEPTTTFGDLEAATRERQADEQTLRKLFFKEAGKKGLTDEDRTGDDEDDDADDDEQPRDDDPEGEEEEYDDEDEDDDGGEDEDDDPRLAKAKRVARSHGLPESAIKAMTKSELLAWSHKASRRESRRNRVFQNQTQRQQGSADQASDVSRERGTKEPAYARLVKDRAQAIAEAHGLGDDHASALEEFGTELLKLNQQINAPELATARSVQEAQVRREAERVRQALGKRFPELSDDEVFHDVMLEAADLLTEGRVHDFDQAVRKAAVIVCESDDGFERRVQSEVKQRHSKARRNGRPQIPRKDRGDASRNAQSRQEAEDDAMFKTFADLAKGRKGAARKTWNRHAQQRGRR